MQLENVSGKQLHYTYQTRKYLFLSDRIKTFLILTDMIKKEEHIKHRGYTKIEGFIY